jgi:hypothetical protein
LLTALASIGSAQEKSLVLYYSFDEGAGDTTKDFSGNGYTGKLVKGVSWTDGKFGKAAKFDGSSGFIDGGDVASLRIPANLTIEAWVKAIDVAPCQFVAGIPYDDGTAWDDPWVGPQIGVRGGKMATWLNIASKDREYDSGVVKAGEWTHIAFTFSGNGAISYVNGGEVANQKDRVGNIEFKGTPHFVVGVRSMTALGEYFKGDIDEVAAYSRVLTPQEIQRDMSSGIFSTLTAVKSSGKLATTWGNLKIK